MLSRLMARPSVKDERTEAILAAFERCVARHGVEGATLQRTADEAGLARLKAVVTKQLSASGMALPD